MTSLKASRTCDVLIFVGASSPFHAESVHMSAKMDKKTCALVEVGKGKVIISL